MLIALNQKYTQGQYLNYEDEGPVSPGSKTHKFSVSSRYSGALLGYVKWFVQWRQYCFFPLNGAIFDKSCMREIAEFSERATETHRGTWNKS